MDKYIRYPKNVRLLAKQIMDLSDDYWTGQLKENDAKFLVNRYAKETKLLTDNGKDINKTIKSIIAKHRMELVDKFLDNFQLSL